MGVAALVHLDLDNWALLVSCCHLLSTRSSGKTRGRILGESVVPVKTRGMRKAQSVAERAIVWPVPCTAPLWYDAMGVRGVQLPHGEHRESAAHPLVSHARGLRSGATGRGGDRPGRAAEPGGRPVQADGTRIVGGWPNAKRRGGKQRNHA